jgi:hypothetical protein
MLDVEEPPEGYGVDQVTLLARDPYTLFAHWEVTPAGREQAGGFGGELVLRLHALQAPTGPAGPILDERLHRDLGRGYLPAPFPGALVDAAIGIRRADGGFTPIAFAPRLRVPHASVAEDGPVEWMEVPPALSRGLRFERPVPLRRGSARDLPGAARRMDPDVHGGAAATAASSPASPPTSSRGAP